MLPNPAPRISYAIWQQTGNVSQVGHKWWTPVPAGLTLLLPLQGAGHLIHNLPYVPRHRLWDIETLSAASVSIYTIGCYKQHQVSCAFNVRHPPTSLALSILQFRSFQLSLQQLYIKKQNCLWMLSKAKMCSGRSFFSIQLGLACSGVFVKLHLVLLGM